jgi:hypothetical protein
MDRQHRNATLSTVSLGVAAAGALGTLGYWLFWPKNETRSALRLKPLVGLFERQAGVLVEGGF